MHHNGIVTNATQEDLSSLIELEALFPSDAISRRQFLYHIHNPRAILLVVRTHALQAPLGYALFLTRKGHAARFYSLIVHTTARGQGLARLLCQKGLTRLGQKGASAVSLEVDAADVGAIRLYESLGFKAVGIIENYYEDGRNALKMKTILKA